MFRGGSWLPPHGKTPEPATARSRPVWPSVQAQKASTACPPIRQPAGLGPTSHVVEPFLLGLLPRTASGASRRCRTHGHKPRRTAGIWSCCRSQHRFFFNDTATTEIYTLSLHDALPI